MIWLDESNGKNESLYALALGAMTDSSAMMPAFFDFTTTYSQSGAREVAGEFPRDAMVWQDERGLLRYTMPMRSRAMRSVVIPAITVVALTEGTPRTVRDRMSEEPARD